MPEQGYYRHPTIYRDTIVFASEDDLWSVPAAGGIPRRLTAGPGAHTHPAFSPDGSLLAFAGRDEGAPEVYVMLAEGGPARRLTYLGADTWVAGWHPDGSIVFASNTAQPDGRIYALYAVDIEGGLPRLLPTGPAVSISFGPGDGAGSPASAGPAVGAGVASRGAVIGRHATDLARWKRYRGGLTGALWIDRRGAGDWQRLIELQGNEAMPRWLGDRIYFLSDHEGIANLYSCLASGQDLRRHTHHNEYYVRQPATDGRRLVYVSGADLYVYDPAADIAAPVTVDYRSPRAGRARRFVDAADYLQGYAVHPAGHSVALICRGRPYTMGNWEGAVVQYGRPQGARYRLAAWLADGQRLVMVGDAGGEEAIEVHAIDPARPAAARPSAARPAAARHGAAPSAAGPERADSGSAATPPAGGAAGPPPGPPPPGLNTPPLEAGQPSLAGLDIGRPADLVPSPVGDLVALSNHRHELIVVDLAAGAARVLDRSRYDRLQGLAWSPDGAWLAYAFPSGHQTTIIKLCRVASGETWEVTRPVLHDVSPAFDPDGRYLYFLSYRQFDPVYDNLQFDLNFPLGVRPYLVTLRADLPSPFVPTPHPLKKGNDERDGGNGEAEGDEAEDDASRTTHDSSPISIDLEGISDRIVAFPVPEGRYGQIYGIKDRVLFSTYPVAGALAGDDPDAARGKIHVYDLEEQEHETLIEGVSDFEVSLDGETVLYRAGDRLRAVEAGKKPPDEDDGDRPGRKTGWIGLDRVRVSVEPAAEWAQMYREAWRLQRDQFWTADMSGVDWLAVYRRYLPLLDRIGTRAEFSDLLWEMQGELGTSHAFEMGGDYPSTPDYRQGFLGADIGFDPESGSYYVASLVRGDVWDPEAGSPLARPGVRVQPGDRILSIDGLRVGAGPAAAGAAGDGASPQQLLVGQAGNHVLVTFAAPGGGDIRSYTLRALRSDLPARYRDWVEANRLAVHEATGGRIGYVHIPDMGESGYAEFHRGYLLEVGREGLIVDVRNNGGGFVSQLILEKLARRRLGYDVHRWGEPIPYPEESVAGPIVALCNELAGSDGDMFSHAFKLMGLGPLIGKRTWGGVIGIEVRDTLVDGGVTTQPEFSTWFKDVGWRIENYGADPDIVVEITPQDYVAGRDPQLDAAIAEVLRLLAEHPPLRPGLTERPRLPLPLLPRDGA